MTAPRPPCWEIATRWPKFCAALANGRKRCRKGTCYLRDASQAATQPPLPGQG